MLVEMTRYLVISFKIQSFTKETNVTLFQKVICLKCKYGFTREKTFMKMNRKTLIAIIARALFNYVFLVQKGDFLYRIARKHKVTLAQLAAWNPEIMKQKYIYPGQKVRVK